MFALGRIKNKYFRNDYAQEHNHYAHFFTKTRKPFIWQGETGELELQKQLTGFKVKAVWFSQRILGGGSYFH